MKHCDKIMIVEDDAGIRHYLQSTLSNAGYDTVAVPLSAYPNPTLCGERCSFKPKDTPYLNR